MGPNRWSQSRKAWVGGAVAWGILFGSPVLALPEWAQRPPGDSGSTVWFVGQALDQTDLTNGRQRAQDVAFDHLMTAVGVESASAIHVSQAVGEAYSQFSSVAEGQLAPSKWQVERYATPEGTRWNIWVLCGVPRGRFEELQATWSTTYKPKIELERLSREAAVKALRERWAEERRKADEAKSRSEREEEERSRRVQVWANTVSYTFMAILAVAYYATGAQQQRPR